MGCYNLLCVSHFLFQSPNLEKEFSPDGLDVMQDSFRHLKISRPERCENFEQEGASSVLAVAYGQDTGEGEQKDTHRDVPDPKAHGRPSMHAVIEA